MPSWVEPGDIEAIAEASTGTYDGLLRVLRTGTKRQRRAALEILGLLKCRRAVPVMFEVIGDTNQSRGVRDTAAECIRWTDSKLQTRLAAGLLNTAHDTKGQMLALELLGDPYTGHSGFAPVADWLRRANPSHATRLKAAEVLGDTSWDVDVDRIADLVTDAESFAKFWWHHNPRQAPDLVVQRLIAYLGKPLPSDVKYWVAAALVRLGGDAAIAALAEAALRRDEDAQVRSECVTGIEGAGAPKTLMRLVGLALDRSEETEIRQEVINALGVEVCLDAWEALQSVLTDEDVDATLRSEAAEALGRLRDPASLPTLLDGLHDPSDAIRASCATALGWIGDLSVRPALKKLAGIEDAGVARAAREALSFIASLNGGGAPKDVKHALEMFRSRGELKPCSSPLDAPFMLRMMRTGWTKAKDVAMMMACEARDPQFVAEALRLLDHRSYWVRSAAVLYLGAIDAREYTDLLLEVWSRDRACEVRSAIGRTLLDWGHPRAIELLKELAVQPLRERYVGLWVRQHTVRLLGDLGEWRD